MATLPLPVAERRLGGLPAAGRFAVGFGSPKCTSSSGRKLGANHNIGDIKEFSAYQKNASNVIPSTWEIQNLKLWSLEDPAENKAQDGHCSTCSPAFCLGLCCSSLSKLLKLHVMQEAATAEGSSFFSIFSVQFVTLSLLRFLGTHACQQTR
ncbi:uncharacterized protein LJ206_016799 isoform 3-T3 [Theristicus caerulescens]